MTEVTEDRLVTLAALRDCLNDPRSISCRWTLRLLIGGAANHVDGTPCWWCGRPMYRDRTKNPDFDLNAVRSDGKPDLTSGKLAGDHSDPLAKKTGSVADRLLHGLCNKQRGDGSHDDQRPALQLVRQQPSNLGDLVMGWPA